MLVKIRKTMDMILPTISAVFFLIGVLATAVGVIDRTLGLGLKAVWAEEVTRYSIIWAAMLLMGIGFRKGTQTSLTLLAEHLNGNSKRILNIIVDVLVIFMFGILFLFGLKSAITNRAQLSPVLQISMFYPHLSVSLGSFFVVFEVLIMLFEEIFKKN